MLVESVKDYAIFMLDSGGHIATWNAGAERIKGYTTAEIIGHHFSKFYPESDVLAGKCEYELEVAAREGRFEDEGWRVRKDGTQFWANVIISAVRDRNGRLVGFSKVTRDLTERRRNEEERAARLAAEQANRAKDDFIAMLGHELRNPLAPIVTALQLMKLRNTGQPSREVQVIERQVQHMMHLVDDLLDVARITRGKLELKRKSVDIRGIVATAIEIASPLLEQRQHHFNVEVPGHELVVDADPARLTQVIANLLTNAAKYTEHGGHIDVEVGHAGSEVVIAVHDDGIGIDSELLPRVFDLFVQGYQSADRSTGGLGIGLTLVRKLLQLHNGTIEAASPGLGRGSTFTVRLPLVQGHTDAPGKHERRTQPSAARKRILVVDDNEDARMLLGDALATVGHEVQTAPDAPGALELIKRFKPDVAILDIGLPVIDGYQLVEQLRRELGGSVRYMALTGYGQTHDRERSKQSGFSSHFVKPVNLRDLLETIDNR